MHKLCCLTAAVGYGCVALSVFATDYTWSGAAGDGKWSTAGNWVVDGSVSGSSPSTTADKAIFAADTVATVCFDETVAIGTLDLQAKGLDLYFTANSGVTVSVATLAAGVNQSTARGLTSFAFESVNVSVADGPTYFNPGVRCRLSSGARLNLNGFAVTPKPGYDMRTEFVLSGGSSIETIKDMVIGGVTTIMLDDSSLICGGRFDIDAANNTYVTGGGRIVFKGHHPLLTVSGDRFTTSGRGSNCWGSNFDFVLPVGGYGSTPIQYTGSGSFMVKVNSNAFPQRFNVISSSPQVRAGGAFTQTLVSLTNPTTGATLAKTSVGDPTCQTFGWNDDMTALVYAQYAPTGTLLVTGEPMEIPGPNYSHVSGLAAGDSLVLTAPAHPADCEEATCTGYRLYDVAADGTRTEVAGSPFASTTCEYVHGPARRLLVWQWEIPETTVAATDDVYANGATLQAALDAHKYAKVNVEPGDYRLSDRAFLIKNAVVLSGTSSDPYLTKMQVKTSTGYEHAVVISNELARVENLLFSNLASKTGKSAGAVRLWSGTVDHCIASNTANQVSGYLNVPGGGFCLEGGTVRNSLAVDCQHDRAEGGGFGLRSADCLVENCRAIRCNSESYDSAKGGGIYAAAGTVRNCLVANCRSQGSGFGIHVNGNATVENCTVVDCATKKSTNGSGIEIASGAAVVRNTIAWGNRNVNDVSDIALTGVRAVVEACDSIPQMNAALGNISVDPNFTAPEKGDYSIGFSGCVDGGVYQGWMARGLDLAGGARVKGAEPDMGCFERDVSDELSCSFSSSMSGGVDTGVVSLTAMVVGAKSETVYNWYAIRQDGVTNVTVCGATQASASLTLPPARYTIALKVIDGDRVAESVQRDVFTVQASTVYANENGADRVPYVTAADGSPDLATAFEMVADGGTLIVADGTYMVSNRFYLSNGRGVRIVSEHGPNHVVVKASNGGDMRANGFRMFELRSSTACLSGLTLVGFAQDDYGLVSVNNAEAMVTNCVLRGADGRYNTSGIGVTMTDGKVVDTTFCGLTGSNSGGGCGEGVAVKMSNGVLERCAITNNVHTGTGSRGTKGGLVSVTGGTLRNVLIADNGCRSTETVYVGGTAVMDNCTIAANRNGSLETESARRSGLTVADTAVVRNCVISDNVNGENEINVLLAGETPLAYCLLPSQDISSGEGNIFERPVFKRARLGDWRLKRSSKGVDQGLKLDWMTEGATDLLGNPRVFGDMPDMGCYESMAGGMIVIFR